MVFVDGWSLFAVHFLCKLHCSCTKERSLEAGGRVSQVFLYFEFLIQAGMCVCVCVCVCLQFVIITLGVWVDFVWKRIANREMQRSDHMSLALQTTNASVNFSFFFTATVVHFFFFFSFNNISSLFVCRSAVFKRFQY